MKRTLLIAVSLGLAVLLVYAVAAPADVAADDAVDQTRITDDPYEVFAAWPEESREVAEDVIEMYGMPDEVAESMLIWHDTGDWKRVVAYREVVHHNFPMPHIDVLEGFIDYEIDEDMVSELTRFTGSIYVDQTKGELSARCDIEAANFLSINLGHEVMTGRRTAEDARAFYAETMMRKMDGEEPAYTQGFVFDLPTHDTANPDVAVMDEGEM